MVAIHGYLLTLIVASVLHLVSCAAGPTDPSGLNSSQDIVEALEAQGMRVSFTEHMRRESFPFFSVTADRLTVNDENLFVFNYPNSATAEGQAQLVTERGTPIGTTQISWVDVPNFYRRSSTIVLYVGHTPQIRQALTSIFGSPFAGGEPRSLSE